MLKIIVRDKKTKEKVNTFTTYGELANCLTDGDWDRIREGYSKRANPGVKVICAYLNNYVDEKYFYTVAYRK